jgi:hypothetical protein
MRAMKGEVGTWMNMLGRRDIVGWLRVGRKGISEVWTLKLRPE